MVRGMREEDAGEVKEICEAALGHRTETELIRQRIRVLSQDPAYYLAVCVDETGHRVEGFIQAEKYDLLYGARGWNIIALAVLPESQNKGCGRQLLRSLERYAREQGAAFVRLNSRIERKDAHAFYGHMGYVGSKIQKYYSKNISQG